MVLLIAAAALSAHIVLPPRNRGDECRYSADRSADISAAGLSALDLSAGAGSLRIVGRSDISTVKVRARACASSRAMLDELQLKSRRTGSTYHVETVAPENNRWEDDGYARLELVIEVPASMTARVSDGSGEAHIEGIAALDIDDGSGELEISNISGDVKVDDGSGEISITDVNGSVRIDDGSGEITIRGVGGDVTISDGSGSIDVSRVGRDFTVSSDGSGDIEQSDVRGRVRIPSDSRSARRHR